MSKYRVAKMFIEVKVILLNIFTQVKSKDPKTTYKLKKKCQEKILLEYCEDRGTE